MKRTAVLVAGFVLALSGAVHAAEKIPKAVEAAVTDKGRPEADTKRDADRKPAECIAFAGIKPGDKVVDFIPGGGYFTRIFAKVVGPKGHVYALAPAPRPQPNAAPPAEGAPQRPRPSAAVEAIAADPAYANVSVESPTLDDVKFPEGVDVIWTSQNYHDLNIPGRGTDINVINKAIFNALKPGGVYLVIDHVANAGVADAPQTLHRIDPAAIKQQVTAAGFVLAGESDVLRNAADDHTARVFDSGIRGKTDQVVFKFVKPKK